MITIADKPILRSLIIFSGFLSLGGLCAYLLAPLLIPIILSFVLYALFDPLSGYLQRKGCNNSFSALLVLLLLLVISIIGISVLFPMLAEQLLILQTKMPKLWESLTALSNQIRHLLSNYGIKFDTTTITKPVMEMSSEWSKDAVFRVSNLLIEMSVTVILVPLFTFFLIRDYKQLRNKALDLLPNNSFELGWLIYYRVTKKLEIYIRGIMLQSGIMAVVVSLGFYITGLESPILLGTIAGLLNLIPYIGPLLAMVPPIIIALGTPVFDPVLIAAAIGVIVAAQLIDNVIVVPAVIANAVNLHPITVIVGIIIFGNFFGFIGMIIAIPVLATSNIILTGLRKGLKKDIMA
ncbi:MAG: AI-2E family transporter [Gammaproteobacteria bacterium]|nr:AI-2E family transporter [Gammaproteobacteria bacterium]